MDVSRKLCFAHLQHKVCRWRRGGRSGAGQLGARPGSVIVTRIAAAIFTISKQNVYNIFTEYLQYLHRISTIYTQYIYNIYTLYLQFISTLLVLFLPYENMWHSLWRSFTRRKEVKIMKIFQCFSVSDIFKWIKVHWIFS